MENHDQLSLDITHYSGNALRSLLLQSFWYKNKNRLKAIFNWAAKGLFFLRGRGSYTHSGYHKTLSATIACDRI